MADIWLRITFQRSLAMSAITLILWIHGIWSLSNALCRKKIYTKPLWCLTIHWLISLYLAIYGVYSVRNRLMNRDMGQSKWHADVCFKAEGYYLCFYQCMQLGSPDQSNTIHGQLLWDNSYIGLCACSFSYYPSTELFYQSKFTTRLHVNLD